MRGVDVVLIEDSIKKYLKFMWETKAPEKIKTFCLRLLQNKLPTRLQLRARNVLHDPYELVCVFCFHQDEDQEHLFLDFPVVMTVWLNIYLWTGMDVGESQHCKAFF